MLWCGAACAAANRTEDAALRWIEAGFGGPAGVLETGPSRRRRRGRRFWDRVVAESAVTAGGNASLDVPGGTRATREETGK
jgi:hypothetical protein